ncbi:hypothetical protein [Roseimarinus sediminis]|uniref:hypothetical protein n=1 Tax=Roseimarinus sediminis TaxID=1610899 RepID=UPI003D1B4C12
MTRLIKLLVLLLAGNVFSAKAQSNLYDCENSRNFAAYLFNTAQYELAVHEIERIQFFCTSDDNTSLLLLKSYRKLKNYHKAELYFEAYSLQQIGQMDDAFKKEYISLLMAGNNFEKTLEVLEQDISLSEQTAYQLGSYLMLKNWEAAYQLSQRLEPVNNYTLAGLSAIAAKSYHAPRKKPWLATLMSVILPGSGKAYCGNWGDGAVSLLFTASTGFFAYRAFNKYGPEKVYPWIAGGLAVSYYAANIYGGNRAAVRYNDELEHQFIHETEELLDIAR